MGTKLSINARGYMYTSEIIKKQVDSSFFFFRVFSIL